MRRWGRRLTWLLTAGASEHVVQAELDNEERGRALQLVTMPEDETWSGWCHTAVTMVIQWPGVCFQQTEP